jgi:hypothetical protein
MSESGPIVAAQLQHLLAVVEQRRRERCREVLEQAREQARQLISQAYRDERQRMHRELNELRHKLRQQMVSLAAQRQTRKRQRRQQADEELLARSWQSLAEALLQCWGDASMRQRWVEDVVEQAAAVFVDPHWVIEHPSDWPAQERSALQRVLAKRLTKAPRFEDRSGLTAGLRIVAGGACVDGSVEGLLRERSAIEAELLAKINERRAGLA